MDSNNLVLMDMDDEGFGDELYGADGNGPVPQDKEGGTRKKNDLASSSTSKIGGDGQNGRRVLEAVSCKNNMFLQTLSLDHIETRSVVVWCRGRPFLGARQVTLWVQ